jgi:hypothetical protein
MARSQLFSGNDRLRRCAFDNSAHVKLGDTGDHVSKIQEALVILDNALFTGTDVATQTYGQSTEDAVFDYKTARNIVNTSYQTAPDRIVGIMTIDRMDREMAAMEAQMTEMIQRARIGGFQRCFAAFFQVAGSPIPPPPGREDPNVATRLSARQLATAIVNNPNPDMDDIAEELRDMRDRIAGPNTQIERAHFPDPRCGNRDAFVVGNRVPIFVCPRFFAGSEEQRIRTMVHESAHLTGVGDPDGEAYYLQFNSFNEDPQIVVGNPRSHDRADFADTWAKYVNSVTGQPADR